MAVALAPGARTLKKPVPARPGVTSTYGTRACAPRGHPLEDDDYAGATSDRRDASSVSNTLVIPTEMVRSPWPNFPDLSREPNPAEPPEEGGAAEDPSSDMPLLKRLVS